MSVQTQIDRLASAKAAIKTAVEGKGVTVPDGTLLDGMAALIDAIEAGGDNNFYVEATTFAVNTSSYTVNHNIGKKPGFCAYFAYPNNVTQWKTPSGMAFAASGSINADNQLVKVQNGVYSSTGGLFSFNSLSDISATFAPFGSFKAGYTYAFVFWG